MRIFKHMVGWFAPPRSGYQASGGAVTGSPPGDDSIPARLSEGKRITDPDEAEALGMTATARRLRHQSPYDAVYAYLRGIGDYLPPDPVHRNAMIWRAVTAALDAPRDCEATAATADVTFGPCIKHEQHKGWHEDMNQAQWTERPKAAEPITADCERCGGPVEWIDCPTGGWWAHRLHPADGHDAAPPLRDRYAVALNSELDEEPQPVTAQRLADAVVEVNEADRSDTVKVPEDVLKGLVRVVQYVADSEPYPDPVAARRALAGLLDQFREGSDG